MKQNNTKYKAASKVKTENIDENKTEKIDWEYPLIGTASKLDGSGLANQLMKILLAKPAMEFGEPQSERRLYRESVQGRS